MKKITRKTFLKLMTASAMVGAASACTASETASSASTAASSTASEAATDVSDVSTEITLDRFVLGLNGAAPVEGSYQYTWLEKLSAAYPNMEIETLATTTDTAEQVYKTAITSEDPFAVGQYWGTRLNSFYDNGMCLDLSDKIDPALLDLVSPAMMDVLSGDNGEVWGIPYNTTFHTVFYNVEIFDAYGFEEPKTWAEFTDICATLKKDDIFGFTINSATMQDCLYGITYAELEKNIGAGTAYELASGNVSVAPGSEAGEVLRYCIQQVCDWYDAGYWYPGEGAVNTTADDANAAFAQGRSAMIFNYSGGYGTHMNSCDFEVGTFQKPTSEAGMTSYENIELGAYFIPVNASEEQIAAGIAFLEMGLAQDIQDAVVSSGNLPSVTSYEFSDVTPVMQELFSVLDVGDVISGVNPTRTSSEMQTFIKQQVLAAPASGVMTIDETLEEMERIRLDAIS